MATMETIKQGLSLLSLNYQREADQMLPTLWHESFRSIADDVFLRTVMQAIRECQFFPNISEFSELLRRKQWGSVAQIPALENHISAEEKQRQIEVARQMWPKLINALQTERPPEKRSTEKEKICFAGRTAYVWRDEAGREQVQFLS